MMSNRLPPQLAEEYWQEVEQALTGTGVVPATAAATVAKFRRKVTSHGETIYNTDPERVAEALRAQLLATTKKRSQAG